MMTMALTGGDKIYDNFKDLTQAIRDKILKKAMKRTMAPMLAVAQSRAPRDLGILADNIIVKITTKGGKGETVRGMMGPARGVRIPIGIISRGKHKGQALIAVPTRYAHLIEFGHLARTRSEGTLARLLSQLQGNPKSGGRVAPHPFMRPAWDEFGGEAAVYTFADEMQAGIAAEVIRFAISASAA